MQALAIISLCVSCAMLYGIVHDQITARVCVEYFTIGHGPVFGTTDPTLLGLGWGILATWWVGLLLGIPLAMAARLGRVPKRSARSLVRPLLWLLAVCAVSAFAAGVAGKVLAELGLVHLVGRLSTTVPAEKHTAFLADLWAHSASYTVGFIGGIGLICWVWLTRHWKPAGSTA